MRVECHDMCEDTAEGEGLGRLAQRVDKRVIPCGAVSDVPQVRCSSASVFSSLCSIAFGERCDLGGPFIFISVPAVQTSLVKNIRPTRTALFAFRPDNPSSPAF